MRVRADDPRPLHINGMIGPQTGCRVVVGVGILKAQLVPVAERPRDIRRVFVGLGFVVLGILHKAIQEPG